MIYPSVKVLEASCAQVVRFFKFYHVRFCLCLSVSKTLCLAAFLLIRFQLVPNIIKERQERK